MKNDVRTLERSETQRLTFKSLHCQDDKSETLCCETSETKEGSRNGHG